MGKTEIALRQILEGVLGGKAQGTARYPTAIEWTHRGRYVTQRSRIHPLFQGDRERARSWKAFTSSPLPFPLTFGIIKVCFDLAGLFRNKDVHLC